jgi:hypothetical protein
MPRTARRTSDIYIATREFHHELDGFPDIVRRGELVRQGHELLRCYPEFFEPIENGVKYDVEQATAAPGELRGEPVRR